MPSDGGRAPSSCWCTARPARACARAQPPGRAPQCWERRAIAQQESRRQSFEQQGAERSLGAWASARVSVATLPPRRLSPSAPPRTARRRRLREPSPLCVAPRCRFALDLLPRGGRNGRSRANLCFGYLGGARASPRAATRAAWPASLPARLAACAAGRAPRASRRRARRCAAARAAARSTRTRRRGRPSRGRPRTARSTRRRRLRVRARAS